MLELCAISVKYLFSCIALRRLFKYGEENWNEKQFTLAFLALLTLGQLTCTANRNQELSCWQEHGQMRYLQISGNHLTADLFGTGINDGNQADQ